MVENVPLEVDALALAVWLPQEELWVMALLVLMRQLIQQG